MRESDLLAPTRRRSSPGPRTHDGIIVTQRTDEMWAIDCTSCMTNQGSATVFVVIDHYTGKCLRARATKFGTHHEAIDTLRQAIRATRGTFDRVHHSSGVQKETNVSNDAFEHSRSNCSGSHDSQPSSNSMLRYGTLRIDTTITGSSGVLATRRPRSTDAVSSCVQRDLRKHLCQQWDPVHIKCRASSA